MFAHSGSVAMSETTTGCFRYAAVPQDPAEGPICTPSTAPRYALGRLGEAPCRSVVPSASRRRTEQSMSGCCFSICLHRTSRMPGSKAWALIIPNTFSLSFDSASDNSSLSSFVALCTPIDMRLLLWARSNLLREVGLQVIVVLCPNVKLGGPSTSLFLTANGG